MPPAASNPPVSDPSSPRAGVGELQAFVAVARAGTVGGAARLLGRTQPSISARLGSLEEVWRTRLFRRESRGMALTPEGERLLPRAEAALQALEALDQAAGLPIAEPDVLRVGAGDALGRVLLPRALGRVVRRRPGLEVYLREGPGPALIEALRDGEIDLAFVVAEAGAQAGEGIDVEPWLDTTVDLLVPRDHALATPEAPGGSDVPLGALDGQPLVVLQTGSAFRRHLESAFAARGLAFRPAVEVGNLSLVRRFVVAGLGVAPVPAIAFSGSGRGTPTLRRALGGIAPVRYARAVRAGVALPEAVRELLEQTRLA